MRGLTQPERSELLDAMTPAQLCESNIATDAQRVVLGVLVTQGRLAYFVRSDDEFEWSEWRATDLGRLAARVCPVEES